MTSTEYAFSISFPDLSGIGFVDVIGNVSPVLRIQAIENEGRLQCVAITFDEAMRLREALDAWVDFHNSNQEKLKRECER